MGVCAYRVKLDLEEELEVANDQNKMLNNLKKLQKDLVYNHISTGKLAESIEKLQHNTVLNTKLTASLMEDTEEFYTYLAPLQNDGADPVTTALETALQTGSAVDPA